MKKISLILGSLCLLYFAAYAVLTGLTNLFTYFWCLLGMILISASVFWETLMRWIKILPKWIKIPTFSIAGICIAALLIAEGICIFYSVKKPDPGADYMIVLGAQVRGKTPSYNLARRLDAANEYLLESENTVAILSGGKGPGEELPEAQAMAEYLVEKGVPMERMILEEQSRNTDENIRFSKKKADLENASVVIVTSNFHVFRGVSIAKKQGLTRVEGLGAKIMWFTIPNLYLREAAAILKYAVCRQI